MIRRLLMMVGLPAVITLCAGAIAAPNISAFESDGMARIIASEAGHPYVLVVWSLDCTYCHASMKNLAATKGGPDFDIVTLAIESADDPKNADAIGTATSHLGARAINWAFGDEPAEQLRYQIDPKWHGELPRSYWYDANGRMVSAHSGLLTPTIILETGLKIGGDSARVQ